VSGVEVNEQVYSAKIIVSNADVYFTYKNLLANPLMAKKV
jgi:hypothetical protein